MKTILITLATLPLLCSADSIQRTGKINIEGLGLVTIESTLPKEIKGSRLNRSIYTEIQTTSDSSAETKIICGNKFSAAPRMPIKFKVTNDKGQILAETVAQTRLEKNFESLVNEENNCTDTTNDQGNTTVSLFSETKNFTLKTNTGKNIKLALSTYLTGEMNYLKKSYTTNVDFSSFNKFTIYINNQSKNVQLLDLESTDTESEDAICTYHPYDCKK